MLPQALPAGSVAAFLGAPGADPRPHRRTDWIQRDPAQNAMSDSPAKVAAMARAFKPVSIDAADEGQIDR